MAQEVRISLIDDMNGDDITGSGETVRFSLDGQKFEIDLGDENAAQLREAFAPYVANARRTGGSKSRGRRSSTKQPTPNDEIREWARGNGHTVASHGRIPKKVKQAYAAAHPRALRAVG